MAQLLPIFGNDEEQRQKILRAVLVLLIVGFFLGLFISWNRAETDGGRNVKEEYVAMVATLYDREHLLTNAQERLAQLGSQDIVSDVTTIADGFLEKYPHRQQTATDLQLLAQDLRNSGSGQTSTTTPIESKQESGGIGWFPILLFIMVIVAGGVFFARQRSQARTTTARRTPRYARAFVDSSRRNSPVTAHWKPVDEEEVSSRLSGVVSAPRPLGKDELEETASSSFATSSLEKQWESNPRSFSDGNDFGTKLAPNETVSVPRPFVPQADVDQNKETTPSYPLNKSNGNNGSSPSVTSAASKDVGTTSSWRFRQPGKKETSSGIQTLTCHYRSGDDPYDQIHSIVDPVSRVPIGACGVSSALTLDEGGGQCFGFTIWLQDYAADDEFCNIGLASKWAEGSRDGVLRVWVSREQLREAVTAADGLVLKLETNNLRADARVVSFDYIETDDVPRYACFSHLRITFSVSLKTHSVK